MKSNLLFKAGPSTLDQISCVDVKAQILTSSKEGHFTAFLGNLHCFPSEKVFPDVQAVSLAAICRPLLYHFPLLKSSWLCHLCNYPSSSAGCPCNISSLPSSCSPFSWLSRALGSPPLPCPFLSTSKLACPKLDPSAEKHINFP